MTAVSSQASGAQRRLCWMQRRLQPTRCASPSWQAAAKMGRLRRSAPTLGFSMGAAAPHSHGAPPFVPNGRVRSPQRTQDSGAKRRLRGACEFERAIKTKAAPAYALRVSVLASRRKYGTTRRSSLQVSTGAAAPFPHFSRKISHYSNEYLTCSDQ